MEQQQQSTVNLVGKECHYSGKVTFDKKFEGRPLGICLAETNHSVNNLPVCWFEKSFLGFNWIYKSEIKEIAQERPIV